MKKIITITLLTLGTSAFAAAPQIAGADRSGGCGLGWQVTDQKTLSATSTRGTTNATATNTFAMTSGTSGCEKHDLVMNGDEAQHFAEVNFENLVIEIAQGGGEHIAAFGQLMGCDAQYATRAQANTFNNAQSLINGGCL